MLRHPTQVVPSTVTIAEVLGFADAQETANKSTDDNKTPKVSTLPSATPSLDKLPSVDDLDLSHLSPERKVLVRDMLRKYDFIWSGF